jgi:hypothetical protein
VLGPTRSPVIGSPEGATCTAAAGRASGWALLTAWTACRGRRRSTGCAAWSEQRWWGAGGGRRGGYQWFARLDG